MATESVDDLDDILIEIGDYFYWEGTAVDQDKADFVDTYRKRLQAYYTRECARKVLEGRLTELEQLYDPNDGIMASHYIYLTDGAADEINNALKARIAELRAAIQEMEEKP